MSKQPESRDPLKNPKVGDAVSVSGARARQVWDVTCDGLGIVRIHWIRSAGDWGTMTLKSWRRWAKDGEVIHAAE